MHTRVEARRWPLVVVAATALLTLSACGSSNNSSPSVASVGGAAQGNSQPSAQQAGAKTAAQAGHDMAACLRAHGIQAKDPVIPLPNNDVLGAFGITGGKTPALASAARACASLFTAFQRLALPPNPWGTSDDQATKFSQCMRTTGGVPNWPDPIPGGNPFDGRHMRQAGVDLQDPHVTSGMQKCDVNKH